MSTIFFLGNRLFWKINIWFSLLLIVLGVGYLISSSIIANKYFQEINQQLYGNVAAQMVKQTNPLKAGRPDTAATHDIIHSIMVINPSVEAYLLDTAGRIIDYLASKDKVKLERVDMGPVKKFISTKGKLYILGDNPKNPFQKTVFSAAPIWENNRLSGYAYAVLASEQQAEILAHFKSSMILRASASIFFLALMIAFIIGIFVFWIITKNLQEITDTVIRFKEGDYSARVEGKAKGDFRLLADTFNSMADAISANTEKIQSVDRLRKELVANVSHDLRTPLAVMQGYIETILLKHHVISAEERDNYLHIIADSSKKLSRLVDQLFEYTKLEAKDATPQLEPFLLHELVSDMMQQYNVLAEKRGIALDLEINGVIPPIYADIAMIEQVLQNLLDNALKYTFKYGIVGIRLINKVSSVEICIWDNGIGISTQIQSDIFERYHQSGKGRLKNEGAGLGLAIVKKILSLHNTSIHLASKEGEGSSFWFELPVFDKASLKKMNHEFSSVDVIRKTNTNY